MESDRFRHALIQELGDELQVPLSDLTEGAEALSAKLSVQNSPEAAEGRKLLSDVRRMSRLTGNLLEMSRLQSSGFELEAKKTPIAELFEESLDEIAPSQRQQFHIVTNIAKAIISSLRSTVGENIRVFRSEIPFSVRAAECSLSGESIFSHDRNGKVAAAYEAMTKEVTELEERAKNRSGPDRVR